MNTTDYIFVSAPHVEICKAGTNTISRKFLQKHTLQRTNKVNIVIKLESKNSNKHISMTVALFTPPLVTLAKELHKLINVINGGVNRAMVIEILRKQITH